MDANLSPEFISVCKTVSSHISTKFCNFIIIRLTEFSDLIRCQCTLFCHIQTAHYDWNTGLEYNSCSFRIYINIKLS